MAMPLVMYVSVIRKVQRTPGGTVFVCLPKIWAERYGVDRGSVLAFSETEDGKLLIDPKYGVEPSIHTATLVPGPFLGREIIGDYLLGFDIIRVEAKDCARFEVRDTVKKTVRHLIGLEIIEEGYSSIVLQCLLEPSGFSPEKILRREYAIVAGMHHDVVKALVDADFRLAKSIIDRDDEVNRLYFLLVRILRTIVQNPSLSHKLGVRQIECLDFRLAASLVEAIGDECVHMAGKIDELGEAKLAEALQKVLLSFHADCFEAHEKAVNAFLAGDMRSAEDVRNMRDKNEQASTEIEKVARAQPLDLLPHILSVTSSLRQIYEHSVDIADLVMPRKE
ncbi:phosphate uptake regulator PhoU [Candidatus Bathyarchaeota archaeon]|nr:phosphate uptake regulator PhoU [Candidatus Bathyarchaeota archaeon]